MTDKKEIKLLAPPANDKPHDKNISDHKPAKILDAKSKSSKNLSIKSKTMEPISSNDNTKSKTQILKTPPQITQMPKVFATQPVTIPVDVVNDTTKVATHKHQKIKIKMILTILFYLAGILAGGGIVYRLDQRQAISQQINPEVLSSKQNDTIKENGDRATDQTINQKQNQSSTQTNTPNNPDQFKTPPPTITAGAYGIFYKSQNDKEFKELYQYNASQKLPPASITKLMTALLIVENYPLDQKIKFDPKCENISGGSNAGFKAGDIFTLQDLLYGMLVTSGADATCALTTLNPNTNFITSMNKRAKELNMNDTIFQNAIGFDATTGQVSTVNDLLILVNEILKYSTIRKIIGTQIIEITPQNRNITYKIQSTNDLLKTIPGTIGIKTGNTPLARECLAYLYEEKDTEILIIILGSQKRFEDTQTLLNWAKEQKAN